MKQRISKKKEKKIEADTGFPVYQAWHRGGRTPRYWDVYFLSESLDPADGGWLGYYSPGARRASAEWVLTADRWYGR